MRNIHFQPLARVGWIVPVALVLTLAACGVTTTGGQQPGGATSSPPTATATSTATPGRTPVSSVLPTSAITLTTDHASYTASATIIVTLINHRSTSIFTFDHQTSCTILTLQRQTTSGWQTVGGCSLGRMTAQVEIQAGATMKITIAPTAGQIHPTPWAAGTYRAVLNYSLQKQEMATGDTATTPTFAIS
ncbi:MAG TPA: hypothetical protein VFS83_14915 [Ktedonobacterales bacterium]|nr:hypothetical protein [Ktedonobacterales bacterium]